MYIVVGASCQELPAIQELAELEPTTPIVCFNLKLDSCAATSGAFPAKDVHHRFLCRVKPVYYMRPRSYSLSLSVPPFLVATLSVFRRYPEGTRRCSIGASRRSARGGGGGRPNLGTFKSQLTAALKLADEKAAAAAISQAGFKPTWWEDDKDRRDISRTVVRTPRGAPRPPHPTSRESRP